MKKIIVALILVALMASPAFALFDNGGFEDGTLNGWTVTFGSVYSSSTYTPTWGSYPAGYGSYNPVNEAITASTYFNYTYTHHFTPYNGTYMAKINDDQGYYHATKISQSDAITTADLTETLYVNWGAVLENPQHSSYDQPTFSIQVLKNGVALDSFFADATNAAATWTKIANSGWGGDPMYYKTGTYSYALSGFAAGDIITVEMFAADCGQGGHAGYAFLDGIGTTYQPPVGTPEPATLILLGLGLAGMTTLRKKF